MSGKNIPILLQEHYNGGATTLTLLLKVMCVGSYRGLVLGFSQLDEDIRYDDGKGEVLYRCDESVTPSVLDASADFGVDNAELTGWVTEDRITESDIFAGVFDFAEFVIYRVNYENLQPGQHEIMASGTFGRTKFNENRWTVEMRGLQQVARQPYGEVWSTTCRNIYGDDWCQMPHEWHDAVVTGVSQDYPDRIINIAALEGTADNTYVPGVVRIVSGANAGREMEIDGQDSEGDVRLLLPLPFPFEIGDQLQYRIDCDKLFSTCKARGNRLNFKGENNIPVSEKELFVPGAHMKQQGAE